MFLSYYCAKRLADGDGFRKAKGRKNDGKEQSCDRLQICMFLFQSKQSLFVGYLPLILLSPCTNLFVEALLTFFCSWSITSDVTCLSIGNLKEC